MLLIGSRALRHHFADFRDPRDWDLVATDEELEALSHRLQAVQDRQRADKSYFWLEGALVEVTHADRVPYWKKVREHFRTEERLEHPILGPLQVAPPGYVLLTKQCGLVYAIRHWHKNLEDLCYLVDRVPTLPAHVAELAPDCVADSARMFAERHAAVTRPKLTCHPSEAAESPPDSHWHESHRQLHLQVKGSTPVVDREGAWQGFPDLKGTARYDAMVSLVVEEVMVMAAQQGLSLRRQGEARTPTEATGVREMPLVRWAMRQFAIGGLPISWRYFLINNYREILANVPEGWSRSIPELSAPLSSHYNACSPAAAERSAGRATPRRSAS